MKHKLLFKQLFAFWLIACLSLQIHAFSQVKSVQAPKFPKSPLTCEAPQSLTVLQHVPEWYNVRLDWIAPISAQGAEIGELYNNGSFVSHPGAASNGFNLSVVAANATSLGQGIANPNNSVADDFTLTTETRIDSITFYAYQTENPPTLYNVTGTYVQIFNGNPSSGGTLVWGDLTTNVLHTAKYVDAFRVTSTALTDKTRRIKAITAAINTTLQPGTYWIEVAATGGATVNAVPITIEGQNTTGNALKRATNTWSNWTDSKHGGQFGLPFVLYGNSGSTDVTLSGYNVYRNNTKLTTNPVTTRHYLDLTPGAGNYQYDITAVWSDGCESSQELLSTMVNMTQDVCSEVATPLPISDNFDGTTFPSECWKSKSADNAPWVRAANSPYPSATPHSGGQMLMYRSWAYIAGQKGLFISPKCDMPGNNYMVEFWMYRDNSTGSVASRADKVNIYFSQTQSIDGLTPLMTVHRSSTLAPAIGADKNGWYRYLVAIDASAVQSGYVIFEGIAGGGNNMSLDDITIKETPPFVCADPTNLVAKKHSNDWFDVKLVWTAPEEQVTGTISGYNIYRDGVKVNTAMVTATNYTDRVPSEGTYSYTVKTVWNSCESEGCTPVSVEMGVLDCAVPITQFPWTEGFEDERIPFCWTQTYIYEQIPWEVVTANTSIPNTAHGGNFKIILTDLDYGRVTRLVTPKFDLTRLENPTLTFWHAQKSDWGGQDELRVYYKNSPTAAWELLAEYTDDVPNWTERTITLLNPTANYWIGFEGTTDYSRGVMIDDITVNGTLLPPPPTGLVKRNSGLVVTLNWTAPNGATPTGYNVYRDEELQGNTSLATYSQTVPQAGIYNYCVKAVYPQGESAPVCETVTCSLSSHTITASAGAGGSISPSGDVQVDHGTNKTFTMTPNTGYKISQVLVDGVNNPEAVANGSYTFTNVTANHTISATFEVIKYTITASAGTGGSISPSGDVQVEHGTNKAFTIVPNTGYTISQVLVDGVNNPEAVTSGSYTFTNVTAPHTIAVSFAPVQYTIAASAGSGGSISPSGNVQVNHGDNQTFTITPNSGCAISQVLVDGVNNPAAVASGSHVFTNVTAAHTIAVEFVLSQYTIMATAGSNGSITPFGAVGVAQGASQTFTFTPNSGYAISQVLVDGVNNPDAVANGSYTFTNVAANHTIEVSFSLSQYTITASAGPNGSITPSGAVGVVHGDTKTFTFTPNTGYAINQVLVDGTNNAAAVASGSYTFSNITDNHTIVVEFALISYTITATAGTGGSITPEGSVSVAHGSNQPFVIQPNTGYTISQVLVDGVNDPTAVVIGSYIFLNVTTNHSIAVLFESVSHTITAIAGTGGSISPSGVLTVTHGSEKTFTITPDATYEIDNVLVDGTQMGALTSYQFENIAASHVIVAMFKIKVGIEDHQLASLKIYPNPTTGQLKIESGALKVEKVQIFDLFGKKMFETSETNFSIEPFMPGIYLVRIQTTGGTATQKVVKH